MYYVAWYLWIGFILGILIGRSLYNDYLAGHYLAVKTVVEGQKAFGNKLFWFMFVVVVCVTYPYFLWVCLYEKVRFYWKRSKGISNRE
jgi:hypothetical protein